MCSDTSSSQGLISHGGGGGRMSVLACLHFLPVSPWHLKTPSSHFPFLLATPRRQTSTEGKQTLTRPRVQRGRETQTGNRPGRRQEPQSAHRSVEVTACVCLLEWFLFIGPRLKCKHACSLPVHMLEVFKRVIGGYGEMKAWCLRGFVCSFTSGMGGGGNGFRLLPSDKSNGRESKAWSTGLRHQLRPCLRWWKVRWKVKRRQETLTETCSPAVSLSLVSPLRSGFWQRATFQPVNSSCRQTSTNYPQQINLLLFFFHTFKPMLLIASVNVFDSIQYLDSV